MNAFLKGKSKVSKLRLFSFLIVLSVLSLTVSTFVGSSATSKESKVEQAAPGRLSVNTTPNPGIEVDCERPVLTIAVQIDRSSSVFYDQSTYKTTVKQFVHDLYDKFVLSGGEVNLILFAFASQSVVQNDKTPSGQLVVSMRDASTRDDILRIIDNIVFLRNPNGNDYFARSSSGYDRARGYNPDLSGNAYYGYTNYDDALLDIAKVASDQFNNHEIGKHIDLALFMTDGSPNVNNGSSRVFDPSNIPASPNASSYVNQGVNYATQTVTALRRGTPVAGLPARPPMAVRGVLIQADAESYMRTIFGNGPENYLFASNFGSALNAQLDEIVNSLTEGVCALETVTPSISVDVNPKNISLTENQGRTYTITIRNTSPVPVTDLVITINGVYFTTVSNLAPAGTPGDVVIRSNDISLPLGGNLPPTLNIVVQGTATPTSSQRFADGSSEKLVSDSGSIGISITRIALPA